MNKGNLYLIPVTIGETTISQVIPEYNKEIINQIDTFIVENIKTARRFLIKAGIEKAIDDLTFYTLNKRTQEYEIAQFLHPLKEGKNIGVLSEAGCPGVADPGAEVVSIAQQQNIKVVPLVGPSSILLALMGSGFNGQNFCFNGYLPKEQGYRVKKLKELEILAIKQNQTQLFIETPYRNRNVLEDLIKTLNPNTKVCIAVDITSSTEQIITKNIGEWRKIKIDLHKRPCIFIIGTNNS